MKRLILFLSAVLFTAVSSFADSTLVAKYSKKKINLKQIEKVVKSNDKVYTKETAGSDFVLLEDGTMVNLIFRKFTKENAKKSDKILTGKVSIDFIFSDGYVRETYHFNKDGVVVKAISETYSYQGNDKYALSNRVDIYFIDYKNPLFIVNGERANPSQDVVDMIMKEIRGSLYGISEYFSK